MKKNIILSVLFFSICVLRGEILVFNQGGAYDALKILSGIDGNGDYVLSGKISAAGATAGNANLKIYFGETLLEEISLKSGTVVDLRKILNLPIENLASGNASIEVSLDGVASVSAENLKIVPIEGAWAELSGSDKSASVDAPAEMYAFINGKNVLGGAVINSGVGSGEGLSASRSSALGLMSLSCIYLDSVVGSDTNDGNIDLPKRTFGAAVSASESGGVIVFKASETPYIISNMLMGGKSIEIHATGNVVIRGQ